MHRCPVCGYNALKEPPDDSFEICPCCGVQFGYDDASPMAALDVVRAGLRRRWIASGAKWFSRYVHPPAGWNYQDQLIEAGFYPDHPIAVEPDRDRAEGQTTSHR